jgi:hypothetical protein
MKPKIPARRSTDRVVGFLTILFDFIDRRQVIRRGAFIWVLWLTGKVMTWTLDYTWHVNLTGAEIGIVIAAVWAPMAALQAATFRFYDLAQLAGGAEQSSAQRRAE